jgi:superoxide dismutase, Fe-Mn family
MAFELPKLAYEMDALQPHMSKETLEFHYGKHHQTYITKLNDFMQGTRYEKMPLEEILITSVDEPKIFNNAAQTWNHSFFWDCLSPNGGGSPAGAMADAIKKDFGSFEEFKTQFTDQALALFGSGWTWLAKDQNGTLKIVNMANAGNPMTENMKPIMTVDVWEHAYYIDYRNARPKFLEGFWSLVNWEFAEKNL